LMLFIIPALLALILAIKAAKTTGQEVAV